MTRTGRRMPTDDPRAAGPSGLRVPLACCWLLMLVTFSAPGREGPTGVGGLDLIALAKLGVRGLVVLILGREIARGWASPRRPAVVWCFAPFAAFLGWALVSVLWSPMAVVSLGQLFGLTAQVLLAAAVALRWGGPRDTSVLLRHLCLALAGLGGLITAVDLAAHDVSGLNRDEFEHEAANGLVHPTSAGATASLGVLVLVAVRVLWGYGWARALLVPGLVACGALLVLAHSRTATAMTAGVLGLLLVRHTGPRALAGAAVAGSLFGALYLVADPSLGVTRDGLRELNEYMRRGESDEQMSSLNGRGDLWDAVWDEYLRSPLLGHGYFMTSRTGILDVWSGPAMRTAHNVLLQVLVSTGVIGAGLFLWALGRPGLAAWRGLRGPGEAARVRAFLVLSALWYFGWGQLCESFTGPVQPETVVFYSLLGLAVAHARRPPGTAAPAAPEAPR